MALVDLHLHLDGSLSTTTVRALAEKQGIAVPPTDAELLNLLRVPSYCRDLNAYLEKFVFPLQLLQTKEALEMASYQLAEELYAAELLYAEIRFAPALHTEGGMSMEEATCAVKKGLSRSRFLSRLILCAMRGTGNEKENLMTVRLAKEYDAAVDLAGAEGLFPTADFLRVFSLAQSLKVPYTIHAGEAAGAESVAHAIRFGAKRIGHGVRSVEDENVLALLAEKQILLELCPTSNLQTKVADSLATYPLRRFLDAGVRISINTDNLTVSGTSLAEEWKTVISAFSLSEKEVRQMLQNSVDAAFVDEQTKDSLREKIKRANINF